MASCAAPSPTYGPMWTTDATVPAGRPERFHADLEPDRVVPVDRDVTSRLHVLRADDVPDEAATLRHDARQLACVCLPSNDRDGNTAELLKFNHVGEVWRRSL